MGKTKYFVVDENGRVLAYSTDYNHLSAIVAQCPSLTILEDSHG
jgi:hypothetical protein